jgi:hypothetical protein
MLHWTRLPALVVAAAFALPAGAQGAPAIVDEGTFSLFRDGVRVGREDFSIRPAPGAPGTPGAAGSAGTTGGAGAAYVATANVLLGDSRLTVRLSTDEGGFPLRFTLEARDEGSAIESTSGEARRDLWSGRAVRPGGERAREFRLPRAAIAVEPPMVHHLWFLFRFGGPGERVVLRPRTLALDTLRVEDAGPDRVSLGLRELVARRWLVRGGPGEPVREAWTDLQGRLLRVVSPTEGFEALRDEPPPETPPAGGAYDIPEPFTQDAV